MISPHTHYGIPQRTKHPPVYSCYSRLFPVRFCIELFLCFFRECYITLICDLGSLAFPYIPRLSSLKDLIWLQKMLTLISDHHIFYHTLFMYKFSNVETIRVCAIKLQLASSLLSKMQSCLRRSWHSLNSELLTNMNDDFP